MSEIPGEFTPLYPEADSAALRSAHMEMALLPGGVLYADAQDAVAGPEDSEVYDLARTLDMVKNEVLPPEDMARIHPDQAVWVVEGGADYASVMRRELAVLGMRRMYREGQDGEDVLGEQTLFQFGSNRPIPRELEGGIMNPEYEVAERIAKDHLHPDRDEQIDALGPSWVGLTEFGLNVAGALESGYTIAKGYNGGKGAEAADIVIEMVKPGSPRLVVVRPEDKGHGLADGLHAVAARYAGAGEDMNGKQFVIATDGQRRPNDEAQAALFAARNGLRMEPPVALGDEPGFTARHNGSDYVTQPRTPDVYLNEMAALLQIQNQQLEQHRAA